MNRTLLAKWWRLTCCPLSKLATFLTSKHDAQAGVWMGKPRSSYRYLCSGHTFIRLSNHSFSNPQQSWAVNVILTYERIMDAQKHPFVSYSHFSKWLGTEMLQSSCNGGNTYSIRNSFWRITLIIVKGMNCVISSSRSFQIQSCTLQTLNWRWEKFGTFSTKSLYLILKVWLSCPTRPISFRL